MTMKILKVTDNGTGFGPRGKACMNMMVEAPVASPTHLRLMFNMHAASGKREEFGTALDGFGAVSYFGDKPILSFAYAPRYADEEDVMDIDIVSSEKFLAEAEKSYEDIMSYKNVVEDAMNLHKRMSKVFPHVSVNIYHGQTGPMFTFNMQVDSYRMTDCPPELMLNGKPCPASTSTNLSVAPGDGAHVSDEFIVAYHKGAMHDLFEGMYQRVAMSIAMPLLSAENLRWHSCDYVPRLEKPFTLKICGESYHKTVDFKDLTGKELLDMVNNWTVADFAKMREQLEVKPIPPVQPRTPIDEETRKLNSNIRYGKKRLETDYLKLVSDINNKRVRNP